MKARYSKKYLKEFEKVLKSTWYECGTLTFSNFEELSFWLGLPYDDRIKKALNDLDNVRKICLDATPKGWYLDYIDF